MVAQIERNPRQGVELVLPHQPGAPGTVGEFAAFVACTLLVIALVAVLAGPIVAGWLS